MATTTNYGWTTPDDTGLVKDGASAIRTLGSSVDTTTKALNPSTTLGDIEYRSSTANTNTRLGIGSTGNVLTVSGGVPTWSAPVSGGMTLISTTTLTGSSVDITSIPSTYYNLQLVIKSFKPTGDGDYLWARFNSDSGTRYRNLSATANANSFSSTQIQLANTNDNSVATGLIVTDIYDYANTTTWKMLSTVALTVNETTTTNFNYWIADGFYNQTGAISSITLGQTGASFTSGTALLYGVK